MIPSRERSWSAEAFSAVAASGILRASGCLASGERNRMELPRMRICPHLIAVAATLACAYALGAESTARAAQGDRPHIVLFLADDHTWNDCGPYGATDVRTPNLDRL